MSFKNKVVKVRKVKGWAIIAPTRNPDYVFYARFGWGSRRECLDFRKAHFGNFPHRFKVIPVIVSYSLNNKRK